MRVVTSAQMGEIERRSEASGVSTDALMEAAGLAVAETCRRTLGATEDGGMQDAPVLVLAGPGNNGGDGLVAARHMAAWGASVSVYLSAANKPPHPKIEDLSEQVQVIRAEDDADLAALKRELAASALVVDAVLGTGTSRPISSELAGQLAALAQERDERPELLLVAVDLPSGVNADTAEADPASVAADLSVALGYPKIGHCALPGADLCGLVSVEDIGFPPGLDTGFDDAGDLSLITPDWAAAALPDRPTGGHKGSFGKAMVVAGSRNYVGAAYLAAVAASRAGAGLVTAAVPIGIQMAIATAAPHVTYLPMPETRDGGIDSGGANEILAALPGYSALLVGCGLGRAGGTGEMVSRLLLSGADLPPAVIDADGLNLLSETPDWHARIASPAVVTPHAGEMRRLTDTDTRLLGTGSQGAERIELARRAASEWNKIVVLKGAYTVVASPDGQAMVSPFANPALATAGTGDVLAGVIAGLLAQGVPPAQAAALGVFLHGSAGESVRAKMGEAGAVAGDLLPELPLSIKSLVEG
jgi:ADP-dependent NAD(P)H-hydrate dehydratase / NAD(P)H-hydrate epimerase